MTGSPHVILSVRAMEIISIDGTDVTVKEVARPNGDCRLLETVEGRGYILEYLVSVGPYKIDIERFHHLTEQQTELFKAGHLQLAALAKELEVAGELQ